MDSNIFYYGIFVVLYIVMAISLYLSSRKENKQNLFILFLYYTITSVSLVILMTNTQITIILYTIITMITTVVLLTFIDRTFYQDRKSPFKIILISAIILRITELITSVYAGIVTVDNEIYGTLEVIRIISIGCGVILSATWMFMSARKSLKSLSSSKAVEPWVIGRYKLIEFYTICDVVMGILICISSPFTSGQINLATLLILVVNMFKISTELLAWVMPKRFKKYLNRGYTSAAIIDELSEEEIMEGMR